MLNSQLEQIYIKTQANWEPKLVDVTHLWKVLVKESFVLSISWIPKDILTQYIRRNKDTFETYKEKGTKYVSINIFLYVWEYFKRMSRTRIK